MKYFKFTKKDKENWMNRTIPQAKIKYSISKKDTTYYSVNQLGITPLLWQMKFWDMLDKGKKRIAVCTPRQVGKSLAVALFALRAVDMNIHPAGVAKKTTIGIISATEEQSKKLMAEIKRLVQIGDFNVEDATHGKVKAYFSNKIDTSQTATNNKSTITFKGGNQIICLPPTDRIRGYTFSYVFVDEAAFLENNDIFFESIEPTVSQTDGTICLTSTPNGQQGFYYEIFDPDDKLDTHEYARFWLNWKDLDKEEMKDVIEKKRILYYQTGKEKHFEQEYEASFTVQVSAFFSSDDVDKMFKNKLQKESSFNRPCDCAIDFGMVNSHTVITISRLNDVNEIERLYHFTYPFGKDNNLIEDLKGLKERFRIERFIPDDCAQGFHTIQKMEEEGWNVKPMNFKRDKVSKYTEFRSWLRKGKIHSYTNKPLAIEMKAMQEEETPRTTKIHKPMGGTDDIVDSFVMSCYFYLEIKKEGLKVYDWDEL